MVKKITIRVSECSQCPNISFTDDMSIAYCCKDKSAIIKRVKNGILCLKNTPIPGWCPLSDYKYKHKPLLTNRFKQA